ncbi:phage late control D family protein [Tumebacillus sp. ITR2]|uniref:Phage late control D family protein n=1 Tax=Tumebacillus amylolyticus TaxID=2801339 RepID=A0ABS1JCV6_9BACL|nr:phage late control D family protein [Tumebacillus amylolyticus]MBL0388117.1 phage late control D family protein [Tumebacillus amylolyticus]
MLEVKLDGSYQFDDLDSKYNHFRAPEFEVISNGKNLVQEGVAITSLRITTSISPEANNFTFTVANAYDWVKRDFKWISDYFPLGQNVDIKLGYGGKREPVFSGMITSISYDYPAEGNPTLTITGMDYSYQLMKGKGSDAKNIWTDKKHSEIASEIAQTYSLTATVDATSEVVRVDREGLDDYQLLVKLAKANDYEFFVLGKKLYFRKPAPSTSPIVTLEWGKNLRSFQTSTDISMQVGSFVVRGYDDKENKWIEAKSEAVKPYGEGSTTGSDLIASVTKNKIHYEYTNYSKAKALQDRANALAREAAMKLVQGNGESIGLPELIAGRFIKIKGLGPRFGGSLYLTKVAHSISGSGYLTTFDVGGNAL